MSSRPQIVYNYKSEEDSLSPPEKRLKKEIWEKRESSLKTGDYTDFKIIVGNKAISTHKHVLSDATFFASKFDAQELNFTNDELDQITISNYKYAIVYGMVEYMYTLKVTLSTENVQKLLEISYEYGVDGLFEKAQTFMVKNLRPDNVVDSLMLTEHITNATLLKSGSIDYILNNYFEVEATDKWETLSSGLLRQILLHKMLNERIADISAENAKDLLVKAKKHHVKKLTEAVQKFLGTI